MDLGLSGKNALVVGGSRGIGLGIAEQLLAEGARVTIASHTEQAFRAAEALQGRFGDSVRALTIDLASAESAATALSDVVEMWGAPLDALVISGGGPKAATFLDSDDDAWRQAFESVFLGPLRLAREAVPSMAPGGCIALILSTSVHSPIPGLVLSNGLRPGVAMAAKTLSDELGPRGIRVVGIIPGRIATDRTLAVDSANPEVSRVRNAAIPLGRLGTVEEIAKVAAFVVSPAASYVTGTSVVVDGGALRIV
jgi:3-oxoacyl-[acyl-carrier protein] reductase